MIALDTNILVYAVGRDPRTPAAVSTILQAAAADAILPLQVLVEFANVCRKKGLGNTTQLAARISEFEASFTIVPTTTYHLDLALRVVDRFRLAFFDALICMVAAEAGATTLLSEDMHDGLAIGPIKVLNPFVPGNADRLQALFEQ